mgnify:CR=1 FL=1
MKNPGDIETVSARSRVLFVDDGRFSGIRLSHNAG